MPPHVILLVLDGCRPDALAQAHTPHLDSLWQRGAHSWTAQTVLPSDTLPCHTSMFRGVPPQKHNTTQNTYNPASAAYASIFDLAKGAGLHTAAFYSWEELRDLAAPGSIDMNWCRACYWDGDADRAMIRAAAAHITAYRPNLAFVYLASPDMTGHHEGWMSAAYIASIEASDERVGELLAALDNTRLLEPYTILTLADHGGHDREHGSDRPEDLAIPWFISGPGIRRNHALQTAVHIEDTAPTLAHLLGLPRPPEWDGQPVWEAFSTTT